MIYVVNYFIIKVTSTVVLYENDVVLSTTYHIKKL